MINISESSARAKFTAAIRDWIDVVFALGTDSDGKYLKALETITEQGVLREALRRGLEEKK